MSNVYDIQKLSGSPGAGPLAAAQSASALMRAPNGSLYFVQQTNVSAYKGLQVFTSSNNGVSWSFLDYADTYATSVVSGFVAAAIDSAGIIHILVTQRAIVNALHITFDTNQGLFTSFEPVSTSGNSIQSIAIAVDSNNVPHVAIASNNALIIYNNRIGGQWRATSTTVQGSLTSPSNVDILIDQNNCPQICWIANSGVGNALGNKNNATSFTVNNPLISSNTAGGAVSLVLDNQFNTWMAYQANSGGPMMIVEHLVTNAWNSWNTPIGSGFGGNAVSMVALAGNIYIFYERATGGIAYNCYFPSSGTWLGEQLLFPAANPLTTNVQPSLPFVKWSNYFDYNETGANNQNSNLIDYVFSYTNPKTGAPNGVLYSNLRTAQISTGKAQIVFQPIVTTTSTSSSTSTSTTTSSTSSSTSTSITTSSTSSSTSTTQSTSTSQSSTSSSTSVSTSTSITTSSTSSSTSTTQSTSTSITTSSTSSSTSTTQSTSTSQSSTSSSTSTTQSTSTSQSSTSSSTSVSTSTSITTSSTSSSTSTTQSTSSSTSQSTSTSITTSSTSSSTSFSTTTSTSTSTSMSSTSTSTTTLPPADVGFKPVVDIIRTKPGVLIRRLY